MDKSRTYWDQAEGLRRLVGAGSVRIVPVMSGGRGAGKTTAVVNLAMALSTMGSDVLVIDDGGGEHGVCASLGVKPQRCLTDVMAGRCALDEVIVKGPNGLRILPMGPRYRAMTEARTSLPVPLDAWASQVHPAPDFVLADMPAGKPAFSVDGLRKSEVVVVMLPGSESIMSGYALMKQLSRDHGVSRFHVLLNRLARRGDGEDIARNVMSTAAGFIGAQVNPFGFIPDDECIRQAASMHGTVVQSYPMAKSSCLFRQIAGSLLGLARPSRASADWFTGQVSIGQAA